MLGEASNLPLVPKFASVRDYDEVAFPAWNQRHLCTGNRVTNFGCQPGGHRLVVSIGAVFNCDVHAKSVADLRHVRRWHARVLT